MLKTLGLYTHTHTHTHTGNLQNEISYKKENGITLVALVVTIIILLILATISIQALTSTGLLKNANKAKLETKRSQIKEWLSLNLMEAQSANYNKTDLEILEIARGKAEKSEELKKLGKSVNVDGEISTEEDGQKVLPYFYVIVDNDVYKTYIKGAEFIGELGNLLPVITLENIDSTTNSITIKVKTSRNKDGKLEIYKKTEDDIDYELLKTVIVEETSEVEYTISGLEQNKNYDIQIIAKNGQAGANKIIRVKTKVQLVTDIKINEEIKNLQVGEDADISVTILPENANNKNITWSSSDSNVATIDQNGKITAISEGATLIKVITQDGSNIEKSWILTIEENKTYLYNKGNKCEKITGGWVMDRNIYATSGGIINWNDADFYLRGATTTNCGEYGIRTVNKIDFSKYSKIYINIIESTLSNFYKIARMCKNR